jgi:hypothetical protein
VGSLGFTEALLVIAATMTVGLKRLPTSFWIIKTGLILLNLYKDKKLSFVIRIIFTPTA